MNTDEVITCENCVYFQKFDIPDYGACRLRELGDVVTRTNDFCSYAIRKELKVPEYDDHDVSGLLE